MLGHQVGGLTTFTGETICLEVDLRSRQKRQRTAHLFVDRRQSPLFFHSLPQSVQFGLYFVQPGSLTFHSLQHVGESSAQQMKGEFGYAFDGEAVECGVLDESLPRLMNRCLTSLDATSVGFPQPDSIKREENTITHHGPPAPGNCFIGGDMTSVCNLFSSFLHSLSHSHTLSDIGNTSDVCITLIPHSPSFHLSQYIHPSS